MMLRPPLVLLLLTAGPAAASLRPPGGLSRRSGDGTGDPENPPPPAILADSRYAVSDCADAVPDAAVRNLRPVIGVFAQRTDTAPAPTDEATGNELRRHRFYIPASYASWIGQAGGRALPILLDRPGEYYEDAFRITSGLLLPGGNQGIDPGDVYTEEGRILWDLARAANDAGGRYPIWGTCLGFEEMAVLATGDGAVISDSAGATNAAMSLDLVPGADAWSRLLNGLPPSVVASLRGENVTFNSHHHGLLAREYGTNARLRSFFRAVSYNSEPGGGESFVSTMEARDYPFYGTQWHPEKNNFEWSAGADCSNIPHTQAAVAVSRATADFFLEEARKSRHAFPEDRRDELIYSAELLYTGRGDWAFEQVYVF